MVCYVMLVKRVKVVSMWWLQCCDILSYLTFYTTQITPKMWSYFPKIFQAVCGGWVVGGSWGNRCIFVGGVSQRSNVEITRHCRNTT